jgi:thiol-disulfide isomerase/thioredoxin
MHQTLRLPFALGALMLILTGALALAGAQTRADLVGKPAPAFQADFAINGNGKPVKLAELKGKVVLLTFWGIWLSTSRDVLPRLQEWHDKYKGKGLVVVGVTAYNSDFNRKIGFDKLSGEFKKVDATDASKDRQMLRDFAAAKKLTFLMMKLPKVEFEHALEVYGVSKIPQFVIIDRKGIVRMIRVGSRTDFEELDEEISKQLKKK